MSLGDEMPQMSRQLELPLRERGEALDAERSEEESAATQKPETPGIRGLMELVVRRENMIAAWKRVRKNKGSPGVDGMTVDELKPYLVKEWKRHREELLEGTYQPRPVRQKLIPKAGGGTRMLGIPTVLDRLVQQALLQVLQPIYDPTFSDHSHGFRPGRSAHDALREARAYAEEGRTWVVDVDLSKFFDRVNHDILMGRVAKCVGDRRVLGLIGRYLRAGIMSEGVVVERKQGTPQGGPLSPLLANILLDEVDKEMERRGHAFTRYADDSRVFVRSKRAGERVMRTLRRLYGGLQLVINEEKSAVAPLWERVFLGYRMYLGKKGVGFMPAAKSVARLKDTVRQMTGRKVGRSVENVVQWLNPRLRGWMNYFQLAEGKDWRRRIDGWIRRRLRALILSQWKNCDTTYRRLRALGASDRNARRVTALNGRWWRAAGSASHAGLPNRYFDWLGLTRLVG